MEAKQQLKASSDRLEKLRIECEAPGLHGKWFRWLLIFVKTYFKQDRTLLWTCVAGANRQCVNSRYAKFKQTGMKSDYTQISQCNLQ